MSTTRISSTDLRPRFAEALRSAAGGDPVVITRHGKPVAALIAADQLRRLESPPAGGESPGGGSRSTGADAVTRGIGANDLTTPFHAAAGAPIGRYLEDRRRSCACRLLVDTELDVQTIALLVGYRARKSSPEPSGGAKVCVRRCTASSEAGCRKRPWMRLSRAAGACACIPRAANWSGTAGGLLALPAPGIEVQ